MILTNYFVHGFLISAIVILYALIIYFNYNAFLTAIQNKNVEVQTPQQNCQYNDIDLIQNSDKCTKGENNGLYYITLDNTTYSLSTSMKNYIDVCKTLCSNFDSLSSDCQDNSINKNSYDNCVKNLKPAGGCGELERPLGFRYANNNMEKVFFYAKDIIQINNCI